MRAGAVIFGTIVSVILLLVAGVFYSLSGNRGSDEYLRSIDLIRQIQLVSSDWSAEITRVRANPFADFDTLAAFIPQMARLKQDLTDSAQRIPALPDRLSSDVQAYLSAIEAKEERIERFKTGDAVVRNSARYLPLAATNVLQQAQEANEPALREGVSGLTRDINLYLAAPTPAAEARLAAEIERLREDSVAYAPAIANTLANLLAHADVLVSRQGPTEELFQLATSNEIADLTDELARGLEFERSRTELTATRYRQGVLAVFGILVVFWILLALQQRSRGSGRAAAKAAATVSRPAPPVAASQARAEPGPVPSGATEDEPRSALPAALPAAGRSVEGWSTSARNREAALLRGFVVKCLADSMAAYAGDVADRMDFLRRTQRKIHEALETGNAGAMLTDGADLGEEIESIAAIAVSVHQEMNVIANLARRLEAVPVTPPDDVDRSMTDVNACVDDVIKASGAEDRATVVQNLGNIPEILASKTELRLMLAEVIENSLLAVQGLEERRGIVKVDTVQKDTEILITVIDNGTGIAPEMRLHIFKPFYTSREDAIGVGLTLAAHLVKKYDGVIKINSLPGQGTVARITLPAGVAGA